MNYKRFRHAVLRRTLGCNIELSWYSAVRVYFLDRPLNDEETEFVENALGYKIEQVRIPYVLPVINYTKAYHDRPLIDDDLVRKHLLKSGISGDKGKQVGLVIPLDMHWYAAFAHAIEKETGIYPYLIQTDEHRASIGNPGYIRIMDMEGLLGNDE
jgi:hypothetical protein